MRSSLQAGRWILHDSALRYGVSEQVLSTVKISISRQANGRQANAASCGQNRRIPATCGV
jgi:hypothetical protein